MVKKSVTIRDVARHAGVSVATASRVLNGNQVVNAQTRARILLWSALCFGLLGLNNLVVIFDLLILPNMNFRETRLALSLAAVSVLLFGFVWDLEE